MPVFRKDHAQTTGAPLGFRESYCARQRGVLLRLTILRLDFLSLTVETFRQISEPQAARVVPGEPPRDAQAQRGFFFKAERIHGCPPLSAGANRYLIRQLAKQIRVRARPPRAAGTVTKVTAASIRSGLDHARTVPRRCITPLGRRKAAPFLKSLLMSACLRRLVLH